MTKLAITRRYIAHLGATLSHLCALTLSISLILGIGTILLPFLYISYFLLLVLAVIYSVGILLLIPEFRNLFTFDWKLDEIAAMVGELFPVLMITSAILLGVSFICLLFDTKWEKSKSRIKVISIALVGTLLFIALLLVGIIGGAK